MDGSQFEQELYALRREKLRQIGELGQKAGLSEAEATYPNSYPISAPGWSEGEGALVPWLKRKYDSAEAPVSGEELAAERIEVSVAGRVMAIRVQGKAGFAQVQQGGERIQIYVRKDDVGEDGFALYKLLDLGDHVGVRGFLMRTRTGELTVHAAAIGLAGHEGKPALTFLAKAMLALPDKFHGLEDTELRYRQRYVDLFVNPEVREVFEKRAKVLRAVRKFFDARGYLEVETPMLHPVAGGAAARPFTTHHNALDLDLKLRIAPELYLKRLVVGGMDRVYEINRNFRNEGISTQHNPEFTMLEFYQTYANYWDLMDLTEELVKFVAMEVNGTTKTEFNTHNIDLASRKKWRRLSMRGAIIEFWPDGASPPPSHEDFNNRRSLLVAVERLHRNTHDFARSLAEKVHDVPEMNPPIMVSQIVLRQRAAIKCESTTSELTRQLKADSVPLGKLIAELFEFVGEQRFPNLIEPTIIYDFPLAVSPLSKVKPGEPDWVERFEFYIGGFEVGNAFSELNDPEDQRARFEAQLQERERGDDEAHAMDEDYVRALGYGLPPTAGEGIGIDRLTMILTGAKSIRDVILFPLMRPVGKV